MQTVKLLKTQSKRHPAEYANIDTGETLASEALDKGIEVNIKEKTDYFTISSDEFVIFDSAAIQYMSRELAKSDMARVLLMGNMVKGDCSVLYQNNNHPHDSETLATNLNNMTHDEFYKMVRKLVKKNILSYCVCSPSGFTQKIYMLNPYIARKRKNLNCELNTFFRDVTKPIVEEKKRRYN